MINNNSFIEEQKNNSLGDIYSQTNYFDEDYENEDYSYYASPTHFSTHVDKSKDDFEPNSLQIILEIRNLRSYLQPYLNNLSSEDIKDIEEEINDSLKLNHNDHIRFLEKKRKKRKEQEQERNKRSKFDNDNMIRKMKTKIINMIREFVNKAFDSQILDNDFSETKNILNTISNREFIYSPIYKIFEGKISKRYKKIKNKEEEYNKEIISELRIKFPDSKNYLDKNFHDYLNIIRYGEEETHQNLPKIKQNLPKIEQLITEMKNKLKIENQKELSKYIIKFTLLLYNYERYYFAKSKRRHQRKEPSEEKSEIKNLDNDQSSNINDLNDSFSDLQNNDIFSTRPKEFMMTISEEDESIDSIDFYIH